MEHTTRFFPALSNPWCGIIWLSVLFSFLAFASPVLAVRPFVTDDARVVGEHQMQMETSVRYEKDQFTNLNLLALGPTKKSEITMGFSHGFPLDVESNRAYSITGPLMQFKYLLWDTKPNSYPGLAMAVGASPPWGRGEFRPDRWSEFAYAAITESLLDKDRILIHANIGMSTTNPASVATWGLGAQFRIAGGFHGVAEVYYNDPYAGKIGGAYQVGFRHVFSDAVQFDMTTGSGLFGSEQINTFIGAGLRIVSDKLW